MVLLIASILVLWAAPFVYHYAARFGTFQTAVEKVLLLVLALLIVFSILPDSWMAVGWWSLLLALAGMLLPSLLERMWHRLAHQVHWIPLLFGTIGLALHASLDGAAFVDNAGHNHGHSLPAAVILHRFFDGVFIWWSLYPRVGRWVTGGVLMFMTVFTLIGYVAGDVYFHTLEGATYFGAFQAVVAGSLLHLAIDRHEHHRHQH